jgi:deoxyadenosine/deoxycytidine kinase
MPRITVDGNIASGKSTQLNMLRQMGHTVILEPVDQWPLALFYSDRCRWGFLLQLSILASFHGMMTTNGIWERSPVSSRDIFWKIMVDDGLVTSQEDEVYRQFFEMIGWEPDVHIYIRTDPAICFERLQTRNHIGDSAVTLEYLTKIHTYHEAMIRPDTIIIDGSNDTECITREILDSIKCIFA